MVVRMDLDQNLFPSTASLALLSVSMDNIMSFNIDVCVTINDLITSGENRVENSPKSSTVVMQVVLVMTATAPQFAYIMNRKLQPDSDVLRIHIPYVMDTFSTCHERKPRLHDGTVTEDKDKYRLVRIPPSCRKPPIVGMTRIRKAPRTQPS